MQKSSGTRHRCAHAPTFLDYLVEPLEARMLLTRLAVIGDYSSDDQIAPTRDVANLIKGWNPELIATAGDNNYDLGEYETIDSNIGQWFHQFIYPYKGAYGAGPADNKNHYFPSLGNHDWNPNGDGYNPYLDYFTLPGNERYYSVIQGNAQIFLINSDEHEPDGTSATSIQGTWLKNQLAASTAKWKFVIFHHAPYSSGDGHGNSPFMQWPFQQWGASAVIAGHDHDYERIIKNNFPYFVDGLGGESLEGFNTPIAGSQVRYSGDYGAMLITTDDTSANFKFVTRTGVVIDNYTLGTAAARTSLVAPGTTWKYLDNGSNQGTAWRGLTFDDATWKSGAAELGYGDGDEATVVGFGPDSGNKFLTTYFRKSFNIVDPTALSDIWMSVVVDDGAVVYVNGNEAFRFNMPTGTISNTTRATTALGDPNESAWNLFNLSPSLFRAGNNTIAVEVHQSDPTSSDVSFNLDLSAVQANPTPTNPPAAPSNPLASVVSASQIKLSWTDNSTDETGFKIQRSTDNVTFSDLVTTSPNLTTYSDTNLNASTRYYYRISAINAAGPSAVISANALTYGLVTLIPAGDTWKYLDDGSNQGTAWRATNFADTAWKSGRGQLGYGDGDETTIVGYGPNPDNKFITTYFRRTFSVSDPSVFAGLNLRLLRDDGAVVYLNGTEIYRVNMPTGTIISSTVASNAIGEPEETTYLIAPAGSAALVAGNNTIAVEIHQSDTSSSDISFDLEVIGNTTSAPAPPTIPTAPSGLSATANSAFLINLLWTDNSNNETGFKVERSTNGGTFAQIATVGANVITYADNTTQPQTAYAYRIRANNSAGDSVYSNTANNTTPSLPSTVYLSDLAFASSTNGWGPVERDASNGSSNANDGNVMKLNGTTYTKGLGVHAASQIVFNLNGAYSQFSSDIGVDDETGEGSVIFQVFNGATKIYDSGLMVQATATKTVSLDVTGIQQLSLVVTNGGDDIDNDHADWANARLVPAGSPTGPAAPTNLGATAASATQINLAWTDGSTNETGFKIERSIDNITFTQIATVGANVTTYNNTGLTANTLYYYRVRATNASGDSAYTTTASTRTSFGALPSPWLDADIGTVGAAGSAGFAGNVYQVKGAGTDIGGTADSLNFAYRAISSTSATITARVATVTTGTNAAEIGISIRESLAANARNVTLVVTPNGTVNFVRRTTAGATATQSATTGLSVPIWLRIVRSGNNFTVSRSTNGTTFTQVGTVTIAMAANAFVGMVVSAHGTGLNTSTFDNVTIS